MLITLSPTLRKGSAAAAAPPQRLHPAGRLVRGRGALRRAAAGQPHLRGGRAQPERRGERAGPAAAHPRARKPHNVADHLAETQPAVRVANMRSVCVQSRRPTCSRRSSRERS